HADPVDPSHIRLGTPAVQPAESDDREDGKDDADDALEHSRNPRTVKGKRAELGQVFLQDVAGKVLVAGNVLQPRVDVGGVDLDRLAGVARRLERDVVEQALHHRVQTPRADVLLTLVDGERDL